MVSPITYSRCWVMADLCSCFSFALWGASVLIAFVLSTFRVVTFLLVSTLCLCLRQMLYESAEQMARLGGVQPSQVIELLNDRTPQCPVQLQTLQFKPWKPPPTSWTSSETGGASGDAAVAMAATTTAADGAVGAEDVGERNDTQGDDGDTEVKRGAADRRLNEAII